MDPSGACHRLLSQADHEDLTCGPPPRLTVIEGPLALTSCWAVLNMEGYHKGAIQVLF